MTGKTVLVTGGTGGIGRATAEGLAALGARVGIVGRDRARTAAVAAQIAQHTHSQVDGLAADLSSQAEVRRLAAEVSQTYPRLDVLVNNVGGYWATRHVTADGLEHTFAVNHLAPFLLTTLLLDLLKASAPSRVVTVSSGAQAMGRIDFEDLQGARDYNGQRAYNQSKLANVLFTYELARRLEGTGVTANVLHPGVVRTAFGREDPAAFMRLVTWVVVPFMKTPTRGRADLGLPGVIPGCCGRHRAVFRQPQAAPVRGPFLRHGGGYPAVAGQRAARRPVGPHEGRAMRLGFHIVNFTLPGGPAELGDTLARTARAAEEIGADNLSVMDHYFQLEMAGGATQPMLEGYTTLGFLAGNTSTVELQLLVTGVTYRHPGLLAKIVSTLDVLSGGRAVLGIGAAWYEREHRGLGVAYPPIAERFERLEETLQIVLQMWGPDDGPFTGKHYQLAETLNVPQPVSTPHPPIMIGGQGERKTLRLVAKYADACNLFAGPQHGARTGPGQARRPRRALPTRRDRLRPDPQDHPVGRTSGRDPGWRPGLCRPDEPVRRRRRRGGARHALHAGPRGVRLRRRRARQAPPAGDPLTVPAARHTAGAPARPGVYGR